jgi:exopolyphosphatase / guanosine-5'-triphosphate,3'-diphosphate pyrophosphatase
MSEAQDRHLPRRFAALDLGTNNCRLLVAAPARRGYRVLGGYSRIVRLGEGLATTGQLAEPAMNRTVEALQECARRIAQHAVTDIACVATQACRLAANGSVFLERVKAQTGLSLKVITPEEEARLSALGCAELVEPSADISLIVDIGGGSTELSFVEPHSMVAGREPRLLAWASLPIGVVSLADAFPEADQDGDAWYAAMMGHTTTALAQANLPEALAEQFAAGRGQMIGTSGAVTSLAGVHLNLPRYRRAAVDGVWFKAKDCAETISQLRAMSQSQRSAHPCIGPERADLVVPGSAILEALTQRYPSARIRVADRGLREGLLWRMARHGKAWGGSE